MKILLQYLKPYKLLVVLVLFLAAINIGFSLVDPIIFGKLVDLANYQSDTPFNWNDFLYINTTVPDKKGSPKNYMVLYGCYLLLFLLL